MYKNKFMRLDVNQKSWWWKEYKELPRKALSQLEMRIERVPHRPSTPGNLKSSGMYGG